MGKLEQNTWERDRRREHMKVKGNAMQCGMLCWILEEKKGISGKMEKSKQSL